MTPSAPPDTAEGKGDGKKHARTTLKFLRNHFAVAAVFIPGTALSIAAFVGTKHYFRSGEQQEFERQAAHYVQTVVNVTRRHEQYVLDLAAVTAAAFGLAAILIIPMILITIFTK